MASEAGKGLVLAVLVLGLNGCATVVGKLVLPSDGIRPAQYGVTAEKGVAMRTDDGVALVSDVYRPVVEGKVPTLLVRIPFSDTFKNRLSAVVVARFWATRGYNVVIQGTRGRYKSGGDFYPLRHEAADGRQTLAWLARQPWFDGRLGMWGGSAYGHTEWAIASERSPAPGAFMIQIASTSFREMFHPGGAFSLESALYWAARSHGAQDHDVSYADLERGFAGFPLIEADDRAVGEVAFFDDWLRHADDDSYWAAIDGHHRAADIAAPALLMAGWYDPFLPTQLRDFETIKRSARSAAASGTRLIIGPWTHADPVRFADGSTGDDYRPASIAPSIAWFDHHLRGLPLAPALRAPVRIYVMGENRWREENEWPLARTRYRALYLSSDRSANSAEAEGKLAAAPSGREESSAYLYDPRRPVPTRGGAMLGDRAGIALQNDVEARDDVLVFSTVPLDDDLEVTGPVSAVLYVSTSAPSTDFTVKLVDVHSDGKAYNVSDGILRRNYVAGMPTEITVELWPTSLVFRRGHRIRVEVSSSNYPRYDRNPNTGRDIATELQPVSARQTIYHHAGAPSRIILPVIPRS